MRMEGRSVHGRGRRPERADLEVAEVDLALLGVGIAPEEDGDVADHADELALRARRELGRELLPRLLEVDEAQLDELVVREDPVELGDEAGAGAALPERPLVVVR